MIKKNMLEFIDINKNITLVGYSRLIGKPLEKYFKSKGINPIICNSKTTTLPVSVNVPDTHQQIERVDF